MLEALVTVAALALGAPGVELRASAGALERTRMTTQGGETLTTTALEATPAVALDLRGPDVEVGAGYAPVLRVPEVGGGAELDLLHRADLRLLARVAPTWRADLSVEGEAGRTDLRTSVVDAGAGNAIPTLAIVRTARIGARGRLEARLDPRTLVAVRLQGSAGGGQDAASRALLPVQQTVEGEGRLAWNATRHDVLSTRLQGGAGRTPTTGARYGYATLTGGLAHRFAPALEASGGLGVAALHGVDDSDRHLVAFEPSAEAAVTHAVERPARIDTRLEVRLAPYLDTLVGGANQRLQATATSGWRFSQAWRIGARGTVGRALSGPARALGSSAEVRLDWVPADHVRLGIGATGEWQRARAGSGLPEFTDYGVFVAAGLDYGPRAPPTAAPGEGGGAQNGAEGGRGGVDRGGAPGGRGAARTGRDEPPTRGDPLP